MSENLSDLKRLQELVKQSTTDYEELRKLNQWLGIGLGLLGIALSLGGTVSGILLPKDARISAIFGAGAAATQAILFAYPVDKRARVYRVLTAKNKNIAVDLEFSSQSAEQLQKTLQEFKLIRMEAAKEESSSVNSEDGIKNLEALLQKIDLQQPLSSNIPIPETSSSNGL
jgi:anthranilate/para-aminobenzoate synthase component II